MSIENEPEIQGGSLTALDRARILSQALADAARIARISKRSRRLFTGGGFQARRGARALRLAFTISFILVVAIPSLSATIYYSFIASDQYVAEAKFTVSGGMPPVSDGIGAFTGIPAIAIVQDTQIVVNYIHSRAAVEKLESLVDIRKVYATRDADWLSRFNPKKPIEKLVRYWDDMTSASISMPGGIVTLKVRAFTPQDATKIANAVLEISESLINELNDRMNHDAVTNSQKELDLTFRRLTKAQVALETARNDTGLLDAVKVADALSKLITGTRSSLLKLQAEYTTDLKYVSASAPQMRALKSRIEVTRAQITELESKLTHTKLSSGDGPTLANSITKFSELNLEHQIAEHLYSGAAASLEIARVMAERKTMYLDTFVKPVLPQEPQYPRRLLMICLISLGTLTVWGACCALAVAIRNYKA